ncbi:neuronal acetylcholine receptor subunit beta-3-like [Arctopsyche grandis]|uniref:neuronal acetylcholine receptor subunit beta-3-like n=1 Tax=Arctopsyche grandis TaxID=121162 RepID=UPI00406D8D51
MWNTLNVSFVLLLGLYLMSNVATAEECGDVDSSFEISLQKKLLCKYDSTNRPVKNHNTAVNVTIRMLLRGLRYSAAWAHSEVINIESWMSLKWIDEYMTWNPDEFGGLTTVLIQSSRLWTPDFSVFNGPKGKAAAFSYPCQVTNKGLVTCIPQLSYTGFCSMNYKNWPYDRQNCSLLFGSWMHKGEQVNYTMSKEPISLVDYRANKYWKLISVNATRNPGIYKNLNDTYPSFKFSFLIERHTAVIVNTLIVPALVMVSVTVISLCLNIASTERFVLMLFNIACHFFYMLFIKSEVPGNGDDLPDAMVYFRDSTILSCIVLFHCIILRNLVVYTKTVPVWVNRVTGLMNTGAGKIVFHEFDPADSATIVEDAEDLSSKNENNTSINREWKRLALFFNRIFFLVVVLTYFILILRYLL